MAKIIEQKETTLKEIIFINVLTKP